MKKKPAVIYTVDVNPDCYYESIDEMMSRLVLEDLTKVTCWVRANEGSVKTVFVPNKTQKKKKND